MCKGVILQWFKCAILNIHKYKLLMTLSTFETHVEVTDKTIVLTINSNETILDDKFTIFSNKTEKDDDAIVNIKLIDNLVKEFNKLSKQLIVDYNYEIVDKKFIIMKVLLKHTFNKFGEKQRYINYKITHNKNTNTITCVKNSKHPISLNIPQKCEDMPFSSITITNNKVDDMNTTIITVVSEVEVKEFENFDMILTFTKALLHSNYNNIDNYLAIFNA